MRLLVVLAASALLVAPAAAQNVLDAEPTIRIDCSEDGAKRRVLPPVERAKNRVIIIKQGDKYLWASREGRPLIHRVSGAFHYFLSPEGTGYVKVLDSHLLPPEMRPKGPRYSFMEHVPIMLNSITYWGAAERFDLEPDR